MNKYEKGIQEYKELIEDCRDGLNSPFEHDKAIVDLQELVERATPKKVKNIDYNEGLGYCQKCNTFCSIEWCFCPNCGQALLWKD